MTAGTPRATAVRILQIKETEKPKFRTPAELRNVIFHNLTKRKLRYANPLIAGLLLICLNGFAADAPRPATSTAIPAIVVPRPVIPPPPAPNTALPELPNRNLPSGYPFGIPGQNQTGRPNMMTNSTALPPRPRINNDWATNNITAPTLPRNYVPTNRIVTPQMPTNPILMHNLPPNRPLVPGGNLP